MHETRKPDHGRKPDPRIVVPAVLTTSASMLEKVGMPRANAYGLQLACGLKSDIDVVDFHTLLSRCGWERTCWAFRATLESAGDGVARLGAAAVADKLMAGWDSSDRLVPQMAVRAARLLARNAIKTSAAKAMAARWYDFALSAMKHREPVFSEVAAIAAAAADANFAANVIEKVLDAHLAVPIQRKAAA